MKVLVLLFLVGCAAAFVPKPRYEDVLDEAVDELVTDLIGDASIYRVYRADDDTKTELEQKIRDAFDRLLEKVKDAIDHGKTVKEDVLQKLKELREKMKDKRIEIGEKAKELLQKIRDHAKDFLQKLLDKLGLKDDKERRAFVDYHYSEIEDLVRRETEKDEKTEVGKKLREAFDKILEQIKNEISRGKIIKDELVLQLKELRQRMKELNINLSGKSKEIYDLITEKLKDYFKNLLEKLGLKDDKIAKAIDFDVDDLVLRADGDDTKTELEQKLRDAFDRLLEKVKDAIDHGKTVKEDVIQKGYLKRIVYEVPIDSNEDLVARVSVAAAIVREIPGIVEQLKDLREKMKEKRIAIGEKAKELLQKISDKAKDFIQNLLDKLGLKDDKERRAFVDYHYSEIEDLIRRETQKDEKSEIGKKLREAFDRILEQIKDEVSRGKIIKDELVLQLKELKQRMKELNIDLSGRAKEIYGLIKEKLQDYIKNLLEKLGLKDDKTAKAIDFDVDDLVRRADGDDTKTELEQKLRDAFDRLLEKVKDAIDHGKTVKEDVIQKLKDLREKMKEKRISIGEKAKELIQKIRDNAKDFIQKLLDKLGLKDSKERRAFVDYHYSEIEDLIRRETEKDEKSEIGKKLREAFDRILEQIKDEISRGKIIKDDLVLQLKELKQRMKDLHIDLSDRAKEIYGLIKEKVKDYLKNLLEKLGLKDDKTANAIDFDVDDLVLYTDGDGTQTELEKKVREAFDRLLEKIKDAVDHGKTIKDDVLQKLKELREKMKDMKIDMGEKAKELFQKIKDKAKDFIKDLLDKLGLKEEKERRALADIHYMFEGEVEELIRRETEEKSEIAKKIREAFDRVLEQIKDEISRGRIIKDELILQLKELKQRMKDFNIDMSDRAKEIYGLIKEKVKDYIKNLLEKLGLKDAKTAKAIEFELEVDDLVRRAESKEIADKLRDAFNNILEKIKDAVEKGKTIREELIEKLRELTKKLKEKKIDVGDRARELYEKIKEKAKDFLKNLLDKLGKDDNSVSQADIKIKNIFHRLKDALLSKIDKEALKAKIEKYFGKGTEFAEQLIELLKTKGEEGKKKLLDLVDRILGEKEEEKRSLQDLYDKVRDYFKNLNIELKERYVKFGHWVKETVKKGIDSSKSQIENVKAIAKEFIDKAKEVRKDIAVEALEFMRPYKEDLGTLWVHVKDSVRDVLKRED